MRQVTPVLLKSHEYVNQNQIEKLRKMDQLMFECWKSGFKIGKILELAVCIEPLTTEDDVKIYFRGMLERELMGGR